MQKKHFEILIALLFIIEATAQTINTDYVCFYDLKFTRNDKSSDTEQFILLVESKNNKSAFLSTTIYSLNSLKETNPNDYMQYGSEFPEIVCNNNNQMDVFEDIKDFKYRYVENDKLNWEILKEKKKVGKVNAQLARCNAYGRIWYAWFSIEIPLNYGPYKFKGLPGLIVSLYDSEKKLNFTLENYKKKKEKYNLPKAKDYKLITKEKYYKNRFKILTSDDGSVLFDNAEERKKWFNVIKKRYRGQILIDIKYPQE
ncbi:GLPGLI family protein [Flavobacterium sp. TBRC 19031]|uniref:GLPGLI family protein n=1 Tax=Flavobacterium mekongense TaxID=3379707 RepID=UPI00399C0D7C